MSKINTLGKERATGVEPATSSLGSWHSTAELRPPMRPGWRHEPRAIALSCQRKRTPRMPRPTALIASVPPNFAQFPVSHFRFFILSTVQRTYGIESTKKMEKGKNGKRRPGASLAFSVLCSPRVTPMRCDDRIIPRHDVGAEPRDERGAVPRHLRLRHGRRLAGWRPPSRVGRSSPLGRGVRNWPLHLRSGARSSRAAYP